MDPEEKAWGQNLPAHPLMVQEVYRALQYVWGNRDPLSPFVFTNPKTGKDYNYRSKFLGTICKRLGISKITYHDFRHHTASTLAQKDASFTDIQKILGHERATTTDHYLQSLGESVREAMGLLEGVFDESTTPVTTEVVTTGATNKKSS